MLRPLSFISKPIDWVCEKESFLRLRAQQGLPAELLSQGRGEQIEYGQGVIGRVAQKRELLCLDQTQLNRHQTEADYLILACGVWQSLAVTPAHYKR